MKVIYFDSNDIMYSEEEVRKKGMNTKGLTKMDVRIAENERKRLHDAKQQQKQVELEKFLNQINRNKHELLSTSKRGGGNAKSGQPLSEKCPSALTLQPRHFKKKEGAIWLNMFETISRN